MRKNQFILVLFFLATGIIYKYPSEFYNNLSSFKMFKNI